MVKSVSYEKKNWQDPKPSFGVTMAKTKILKDILVAAHGLDSLRVMWTEYNIWNLDIFAQDICRDLHR